MSSPKTNIFDDENFVDEEIPPKLLVVGDTENRFSPLIKRLSSLKIDIFSVSQCHEAIELATQHDFFLILIGADELNARGAEMAFTLRADESTRYTPVVFISKADSKKPDSQDNLGFGIAGSDYVLTPVPPDIVQKEVSVFLDMYRHRKDLEHSEQLYKTMATRDPLTLLDNREQFETDLKKTLANAKRHGYMVAVLYVDLDGFKPINDAYGHQVGDDVLRIVAGRLKGCTREGDSIARLGGDEFCVLLNMIRDAESAGMVAQKILEVLKQLVQVTLLDSNVETSITVGASIGVSHYPEHGDTYKVLLHNADMAMYQAKRAGRHDYRYFKDE